MCKCHGEPTRWRKDARRLRGGYWYCRVKKQKQRRRDYLKNKEKYIARATAWAKANPERRKEIMLRYWHSPQGQISLIERRYRYLKPKLEEELRQLGGAE